jgi:hypothetical protein
MSAKSVKNSVILDKPLFNTIEVYEEVKPMTHEDKLSLIVIK